MSENHVFISYAHLDDEPLPLSSKGWVSNFDETLKNLLSQKIGEKAHVWRDTRMQRSAIFDEEIFNELVQSLTLVSVVTPRYIKSDYCLEELKKFCEIKAPIGSKSRVFKVVKTLVEFDEMPELFRRINGFDYFKIDDKDNIPREFALDFGSEWAANFLLKTSDLAYEIAQILKLIRQEIKEAPAVSQNLPSIYLAKTSSDFQKDHDNIRRDLLERGYQVWPPSDAVEPQTTEEYKRFVRENLQKCGLSVHLIGKNYGERPEDGEQSYIHLQTIVAAERTAADPNFKRIVWLPKDLNLNQPQQQAFVNEIWYSTGSGVEVLEKPLEELKTNILDALNRDAKPKPQPKTAAAKPSVLVLYDKTDAESAAAVEAFIKERGCSVWSAAKYLTGEPSILIEAQNNYLRNCDAVVIYWKDAPDFWTRIMLQRLQKILGDGREEMFLGEAVLVDGANNPDELADDTEAEFLNGDDELDAFLSEVKNAFRTKFEKGEQK
jgi:hypothetical protein